MRLRCRHLSGMPVQCGRGDRPRARPAKCRPDAQRRDRDRRGPWSLNQVGGMRPACSRPARHEATSASEARVGAHGQPSNCRPFRWPGAVKQSALSGPLLPVRGGTDNGYEAREKRRSPGDQALVNDIVQLVSHVSPPSADRACSHRGLEEAVSSHRNRSRTGRPSSTSSA